MEAIYNILQDVRDYWADHFSRRFLPRRPTLRQATSLSTFYLLDYKTRQAELGMDYGHPCAQLSKAKFVFQDGEWQNDSIPQQMPLLQLFSSSDKESPNKVLKKANKALLEENNYLKLQLELLMDMLTETTARLHSIEKKLDTTTWHSNMKKSNNKISSSEPFADVFSNLLVPLPRNYNGDITELQKRSSKSSTQILLQFHPI